MKLTKTKVAVTGATGMLGIYLCRELLKAGCKVVAVVRNTNKAVFLKSEGVEFRRADLNDGNSLAAAFGGVDAIISNAALYDMGNSDWQDNYQANKIGTENVFKAAASSKVKRIIQISSFGIYRFNLFTIMNEFSPQLNADSKEGGAYRATKQMSEALAWQLANELGISLTTLRPSGIYGARDKNLMPTIYKLMKLPILPVPTFRFPLVYAGDVARAAKAAIENNNSINQAYNTIGENKSMYSFLQSWKSQAGKGPVLLPIPVPFGVEANHERATKDLHFINRPFEEGLRAVFKEDKVY